MNTNDSNVCSSSFPGTFTSLQSTHVSLSIPTPARACFPIASKSRLMGKTSEKTTEIAKAEKRATGSIVEAKTKLIGCGYFAGMLLLFFFLALVTQVGAETMGEMENRASTVTVSALSSLLSASSFDDDEESTAATVATVGFLEILDDTLYQSSNQGQNDVSDDPFWNSTLDNQFNGTEEFWQLYNNYSTTGNNSMEDDGYHLYDVPVYLVVLLSLLYGVISITAVIGNVLVLWVVGLSRRMRTKTNLFIANLALADIIIALFAIPFQFQAALLQRWNLPDFMCGFCPFVQVVSVNVSVFTLSVIALDRYRAIIYPFRAIRISKREATYTVIFIWCISVVLALPQEFDYKVLKLDDGGLTKPFCAPVTLSSTFRTYYSLGLAVIQYVLPLLIISVAYAKMATKLWGTSAPGNKEESRDENTLRNKKKVVKMLAVVVMLFALCWLPLQMYNFLQTITSINEYQYINIIWFCFHWLAMSNSCYNPFIYAIYSDKFQTEFRLRLHCLRTRTRDMDDFGSEASDYEMNRLSRVRVAPARFSRVCRQSQKTKGKVSSIESTKITELQPLQERTRITMPTPIATICNNVKTTEAILTSEFSKTCPTENPI